MKRLIFIQNKVLHYRKSLYNELSKHYNVTVIHSGELSKSSSDLYNELIVPNTKFGPFCFQIGLLRKVKSLAPDVVIAMFDIRWVNTFSLLNKNSSYKFIWWGLDTGQNSLATKLKVLISRLGFPIIFYNDFNKNKMAKLGLGSSQLYVANNTFDVGERFPSYENPVKNKILFVGSFDKRKENDMLLKAFCKILPEIPKTVDLTFVGDGDEKESMCLLAQDLGITERVLFLGRINDPISLLELYKESIVAVSFGQAGLAVLQSLGFGVPYITKINAISGGEMSNIIHEKTGYFCGDNLDSLCYYLLKIINDTELARELGKNAYNYYTLECTIENMAQGFINAIESKD